MRVSSTPSRVNQSIRNIQEDEIARRSRQSAQNTMLHWVENRRKEFLGTTLTILLSKHATSNGTFYQNESCGKVGQVSTCRYTLQPSSDGCAVIRWRAIAIKS